MSHAAILSGGWQRSRLGHVSCPVRSRMLCHEMVTTCCDHAETKAGQSVCLWHMLFLIPSVTIIPEQLLVCHGWYCCAAIVVLSVHCVHWSTKNLDLGHPPRKATQASLCRDLVEAVCGCVVQADPGSPWQPWFMSSHLPSPDVGKGRLSTGTKVQVSPPAVWL